MFYRNPLVLFFLQFILNTLLYLILSTKVKLNDKMINLMYDIIQNIRLLNDLNINYLSHDITYKKKSG